MGMTGKILRDMVVIGSLGLASAYAVMNKEAIYDWLGIDVPAPQTVEVSQPAEAENTLPLTKVQGVAVSIPKSKADGQYWATARVNNGVVKFLVDTGASTVALTPEDAKRAGVNLNSLEYNIPVQTAGGQNVAAAVELKSISVGPVTLRNVRAIIIPEGLSTSLLGMTYLGRLQKVEATQHALILRL